MGFECFIGLAFFIWNYGLLIRYASGHSAITLSIFDSSYWDYLGCISLTAILPGFIAGWSFPVHLKFMFALIITTVICFVTHHYFVRL